jgi:trk system potassium uptake protein TrkA
MRVIVLGCGRVGALVASRLSERHDVTVIDWNPGSFSRLPDTYTGDTVVCNGIDVDCLRQAGTADADVFLALTDGDNRNLMSSQIARQLGARKIMARVYDAERSRIYHEMGLNTISPTILGAERLFRMAVGDGEE